MSVPAWPSAFPAPEQRGFAFERGDARRRTQMEGGPPRTARRFSRVADRVAMSLVVSASLYGIFCTFFDVDLRQGTLPFLMPDPMRDGWPLLDDNGVPLAGVDDKGSAFDLEVSAWWLVTFGDRLPATTPVGREWRVEFDLAVLP